MSKRKDKKQLPLEISAEHKIVNYMHCKQCIDELPEDVSPQEYAATDVGYTEIGLQVWCLRHDCNIVHLDFAGQKFYANISKLEDMKNKAIN